MTRREVPPGSGAGSARRRKWRGWGYEDADLPAAERDLLAGALAERFKVALTPINPVPLASVSLSEPRIRGPRVLAAITRADREARAAHSLGKSYRDVVRAMRGKLDHPPDLVCYPRDEGEVAAVLDWCTGAGAAVIPYGGGSSVVGGVEPDVGEGYAGTVTVDLSAMGRVLEVDRESRAARIEAGALGPAIEDQLRGGGLTLRHFPQSFEVSSLGGWVATRSAGHFATADTHIDDLVEGMRVVTPSGTIETRRLPASGAGPSPDRLFLGSEGALGIVTEIWVRLHSRPVFRRSAGARFTSFGDGVRAARALAQSGLYPANCRLLDPLEAFINGAGDGNDAVLLVGFESADHPVDAWMARAAELCADHGGELPPGARGRRPGADRAPGTSGAPGAWRRSFLRAPYVRDALVGAGVLCETFETAVTWDRIESLDGAVRGAVRSVFRGAFGAFGAGVGEAVVTRRLTHVYPDGAAPYYTVLAPAPPGSELALWDEVKAAASEAVLAGGGTITHHHAVGRDHRPWYGREVPSLFLDALAAAKGTLDPGWICNPGALIERRV